MTDYKSFKDIWAEMENDDVFLTEKNILDFTSKLYRLMGQQGVSKTQLAERLGTSPAYVTKIFRGNANFTLASMTKLVRALDAKLDIQIVPKEEHVQQWFKLLKSESKTIPWQSKNWPSRSLDSEKAFLSEEKMEAAAC
jgi:transcriptional regulator with XRE-family HTH domain